MSVVPELPHRASRPGPQGAVVIPFPARQGGSRSRSGPAGRSVAGVRPVRSASSVRVVRPARPVRSAGPARVVRTAGPAGLTRSTEWTRPGRAPLRLTRRGRSVLAVSVAFWAGVLCTLLAALLSSWLA